MTCRDADGTQSSGDAQQLHYFLCREHRAPETDTTPFKVLDARRDRLRDLAGLCTPERSILSTVVQYHEDIVERT